MLRHFAILALAAVLGGVGSAPAAAQSPPAPSTPPPPSDPAAPQREAMQKLDSWIGQWEGTGWALHGAGTKSEFSVTESVEPKVGGLVLLVQGMGKSKDPQTGTETVGHDALAIVSYDTKASRYTFRHYSMRGGSGEDELVLTAKGMQWELSSAPAPLRIRFLIEIEGDTWHEYGEASRDGEQWMRTMEMTLHRVKGSGAKG